MALKRATGGNPRPTVDTDSGTDIHPFTLDHWAPLGPRILLGQQGFHAHGGVTGVTVELQAVQDWSIPHLLWSSPQSDTSLASVHSGGGVQK